MNKLTTSIYDAVDPRLLKNAENDKDFNFEYSVNDKDCDKIYEKYYMKIKDMDNETAMLIRYKILKSQKIENRVKIKISALQKELEDDQTSLNYTSSAIIKILKTQILGEKE